MIHTVPRLISACLVVCFVITGAVLPGCQNSLARNSYRESKGEGFRLGQEFKLRAGQEGTLEGEGLRITFASVANDSRCPAGVTCMWAGNAEALLEMSKGGGVTTLKLNTYKSPQFPKEGRYLQYRIELIELSPYPRSDKRIEAGEYVATLVVSKE